MIDRLRALACATLRRRPARPRARRPVPTRPPAPSRRDRSHRSPLALAALLAFGTGLGTSPAVHADVSIGDPVLDPLFTAFVEGRGAARAEALDALAATGRDDTRALLTGILEGTLMLRKAESDIVRVEKRGREVEMFRALDDEPLGVERSRAVKRLKLDNRLRGHLRELIAGLGLRSENPLERRAAIEALLDRPDAIEAGVLAELAETETEPDIRRLVDLVQARQWLGADDPAIRLQGVAGLRDDLSPASRRALADIAAADVDEDVAESARLAVIGQARTLSLYGHAETLFFGLSLGSVLVLAAIGLAITFGVMGVINMAHGELIMLGAYAAWGMQQLLPDSLGLALLLSIPVGFLVSGAVGIAIERGVIRFLYGRPLETLLATFGISLVLQQLVRTVISPQNVPVANPAFMSGTVEIGGVLELTLNRLWILAFCLLVFAALLQLLGRTRFGLEVRAVSQNRAMARAMGVRSARIDSLTFGLGAGVAGIAGVALSQLTNVGPNLGQAYIVDSFMVVVFGGVGNLWGTLIGGMTLGVANKLMEPWAGAILAKILVLVFIIAFIQKRPRGLFPQRGRSAEAG